MTEENKDTFPTTKTDDENDSHVTSKHNYVKQEKSVTDKKGNTTTVRAVQYSDDMLYTTNITTKTTNKNNTKETYNRKSYLDTSNPDALVKEQDSSFSATSTYDKKHNLVHSVEVRTDNHTHADVEDKSKLIRNEKVEITAKSFDKKENTTEEEYHIRSSGYRLDQTIKYSKKEKDDLKKEIRVSASTSFLRVSSLTKKRLFSASSEKGEEKYSTKTKDKTINVGIDSSDMLYGNQITKSKDGTEVSKELSQKQIKKELKAARKQADKNIKAITEAKSAQELTAAIPSPIVIGTTMNLEDLRNKSLDQGIYPSTTKEAVKDEKRQEKNSQTVAQIIEKEMRNGR